VTSSLPVDRIAGAPISWGLCEVPGWGYQLASQRVLSEMQRLGLVATEFGPPGFLVADADSRVALLDWMTAKDNPYFGRAMANRLWEQLLGTGLVEPLDEETADNPASHPEPGAAGEAVRRA